MSLGGTESGSFKHGGHVELRTIADWLRGIMINKTLECTLEPDTRTTVVIPGCKFATDLNIMKDIYKWTPGLFSPDRRTNTEEEKHAEEQR